MPRLHKKKLLSVKATTLDIFAKFLLGILLAFAIYLLSEFETLKNYEYYIRCIAWTVLILTVLKLVLFDLDFYNINHPTDTQQKVAIIINKITYTHLGDDWMHSILQHDKTKTDDVTLFEKIIPTLGTYQCFPIVQKISKFINIASKRKSNENVLTLTSNMIDTLFLCLNIEDGLARTPEFDEKVLALLDEYINSVTILVERDEKAEMKIKSEMVKEHEALCFPKIENIQRELQELSNINKDLPIS